MSQKVSRKSAINEDKEKRQTNSPVKEMKKKMAANAEKEKQAAEKATEKTSEKTAEKVVEKPTEKTEKATEKIEKATEKTEKATEKTEKTTEKKATEKTAEKAVDKTEKHDKHEKPNKSGDKKAEKQIEKKSEPQAEKSKEDSSKEDKSGKPEKSDTKKSEASKQKQNGRERVHNGVSDVTLCTNGTDDVLNGTVSAESEDDDVMLVIDDHDHDELFPELTYDDTSDVECFEPPTPENAPSRSFTRRSQPKDKILKLKDDAPATDRKLRSADSPKPQEVKKSDSAKKDSPKKSQEKEGLEKVEEEGEARKDEKSQDAEEVEVEVIVEVQGTEGEEVRKTDTNFSKSRVKVSPYRRSMRLADQTNTSVQANYTGNNTIMEMDISESSSLMEDAGLDDSSYLRGLRSIRGRSSYKPLKDITLRHVASRSSRPTASASAFDAHNRPTGTVVGRKRKPDADDSVELGVEPELCVPGGASKRMRVLERLAQPFRRVATALPTVARRNADIVGINTDLPLSVPLSSPVPFDPESLKPAAPEPVAVRLPAHDDRDNKRCTIM